MKSSCLLTFTNLLLPVFRTVTTLFSEQTSSPVVGSVAQVVIAPVPPGLPTGRSQTE